MTRFFVNHPVLASVFSIVILLLGGISAGLLPVAEYPEVTPPMVRVSAVYPAQTPKSWPTPWPPPSSSRSTASKK